MSALVMDSERNEHDERGERNEQNSSGAPHEPEDLDLSKKVEEATDLLKKTIDLINQARMNKCNFTLPILRGLNDRSDDTKELNPIVELENVSENHSNSSEKIR